MSLIEMLIVSTVIVAQGMSLTEMLIAASVIVVVQVWSKIDAKKDARAAMRENKKSTEASELAADKAEKARVAAEGAKYRSEETKRNVEEVKTQGQENAAAIAVINGTHKSPPRVQT